MFARNLKINTTKLFDMLTLVAIRIRAENVRPQIKIKVFW
jgi:hypothetical protein